ncbi:MAG: PfkB family carbohydrate kinase [Planctomycetota bacterium]
MYDTVGAGDAFTAALAAGLLRGESLHTIVRSACEIAAAVCAQPGAVPECPGVADAGSPSEANDATCED